MSDIEKFWACVQKTDRCWLWVCGTSHGYGITAWDNGDFSQDYAHRVSWRIHFGEIPPNIKVCHTCDTPLCVRPDHLFLGTHSDNIKDMWAKGRGSKVGGRGAVTAAKLTTDEVLAIREMKRQGAVQIDIADYYDVSPALISMIVNNKVWKNL